ncbi:transposase InsO family protein [Rhizobium mongolense]|uniref:Transposase InsO family protein n=1 Tax=Rhizobium mongolense TaxID=57676 RepID=A0A7W6RK72_9HYPH|nr:transposase InsO family protein [Rhizobium mongolense]
MRLAANDRWSLDFVSDQFTDGRRFRVLTVVDDCTRECRGLVADTSLSGLRVARELDRIIEERGKPKMIVSDNGPIFGMKGCFGSRSLSRRLVPMRLNYDASHAGRQRTVSSITNTEYA